MLRKLSGEAGEAGKNRNQDLQSSAEILYNRVRTSRSSQAAGTTQSIPTSRLPFSLLLQNISMQPPKDSERGRYQYTVDELTRYLTFKQVKYTSFGTLVDQLAISAFTATFSHQLLQILMTPNTKNRLPLSKKIASQFALTRRPTEHTITVFSIKLVLDFWNERKSSPWSEYRVGGLTGLLSYLLSRPFDQLDLARGEIWKNQNKKISRAEAAKVIIKYDGLRGFYRNQNLLGLACPTLYRSIFFGLWHKLQEISTLHHWANIAVLPLLASLAASTATAIPDKLRSFSLQVNEERKQSLQKVYGKKTEPVLKSTPHLLLEYMTSSDFKLSRRDLSAIGLSVIKNWMVLSSFALGQYTLKVYSDKNQQKR